MSLARACTDAILSVVLAPVCAACGQPLDSPTRGPICAPCWNAIVPITPPVCEVCGDPLPSWRALHADGRCARCRGRELHISRGRAIGAYDGALRAVIHALKYDGRRSIAKRLAEHLAVHGRDVLNGADVVVPVPLHRSRKRARGFNQAAEIARHLPIRTVHALRRVRATPSQTDLPAESRHENVQGAFALRPGVAMAIVDRVVVLVDDVSTTGATLESCARVLRDAGAREVRALTVARVVSQRP
jgi:ComF family protein